MHIYYQTNTLSKLLRFLLIPLWISMLILYKNIFLNLGKWNLCLDHKNGSLIMHSVQNVLIFTRNKEKLNLLAL